MVWLDGQGFRKNMMGKLMTKSSGKEVYGQISQNGQKI